MLGAGLVLLSELAAAAILQNGARNIQSTYPTWAIRASVSTAAQLELIVEPDGSVRKCVVMRFVGNERLANEECAAFSRYRLKPASGPDGRPMVGRYLTHINLYVEGSRDRRLVQGWRPPPNLRITGRLPASVDEPLDVELALLVNADGSVAQCEGNATKNKRVDQGYVEIACSEASKIPQPRLSTSNGEAAEYVSNLQVRFETDSSS